jgi:hypothetical protein
LNRLPGVAAAVTSRWLVAACILALSGCLGGGTHEKALQQLGPVDFSVPLAVETTPGESEEHRGALQVAWSADGFAVSSESEPDLAHRSLVFGNDAYTSGQGMGWLHVPLASAVQSGTVSNRLVLWDLRAILRDGGVRLAVQGLQGGSRVQADGTVQGLEVHLDMTVLDGRIQEAHLASPQARESPFTFRPAAGVDVGFAIERPALSKEKAEVDAANPLSQSGHAQVVQWIRAYAQKRAGLVPDQVDAQALSVEVVASGKGWPTNAYDGSPLANREESGHFSWKKCGSQDGRYVGYGWDGALLVQSFGRGCA